MAVAAIYMVDHKGGGGGFYMIDNNGKWVQEMKFFSRKWI